MCNKLKVIEWSLLWENQRQNTHYMLAGNANHLIATRPNPVYVSAKVHSQERGVRISAIRVSSTMSMIKVLYRATCSQDYQRTTASSRVKLNKQRHVCDPENISLWDPILCFELCGRRYSWDERMRNPLIPLSAKQLFTAWSHLSCVLREWWRSRRWPRANWDVGSA